MVVKGPGPDGGTMSFKPINRYEIQIVFPDGSSVCQSNTRKRPMTAVEILDNVEKFVQTMRPIVEQSAARALERVMGPPARTGER